VQEISSPAFSICPSAILQAARNIPSALAVATIGSPSDPAHVLQLLKGAEVELRENGIADVQIGGRPFRVKEAFLDDLTKHRLPETISGLRKAR
jgi:hypothetical protein